MIEIQHPVFTRKLFLLVLFLVAWDWETLSFHLQLLPRRSETQLLSSVSHSNKAAELIKLSDLRLAGLLTQEEFQAAKTELLGSGMKYATPRASNAVESISKGAITGKCKGDRDECARNFKFTRLQNRQQKEASSYLRVMPQTFKAGEKLYGLNDLKTPILRRELDEFLTFMTESNINSQESSIRMSTAKVYIRHARLFLGWVTAFYENVDCTLWSA